MSGSAKTLLIVGGVGLVAILFLSKSATTTTVAGTAVPVGSTAATVGAAAGAGTSLVNALSNLFNGPTTAPLTSGASPSNPNNIVPAGAGTSTDALGSDFFDQFNS